jgi:hypothetical protein
MLCSCSCSLHSQCGNQLVGCEHLLVTCSTPFGNMPDRERQMEKVGRRGEGREGGPRGDKDTQSSETEREGERERERERVERG